MEIGTRVELAAQAPSELRRMAVAIRQAAAVMRRYFEERQAIARLRELDDRMLRDIGLHRSEIMAAVRGQPIDTVRREY